MSDDRTYEQRVLDAWKAGQADWNGRWDRSTLRVALAAAGLPELLERVEKLEAQKKNLIDYVADAAGNESVPAASRDAHGGD